jgi:hypothetical protein
MAHYIFYVQEAKHIWGKGLANVRPLGKLKGGSK